MGSPTPLSPMRTPCSSGGGSRRPDSPGPEPTAVTEPGAEEARSLFAVYDQRAEGPRAGVPLAVSSSLHAAVVGGRALHHDAGSDACGASARPWPAFRHAARLHRDAGPWRRRGRRGATGTNAGAEGDARGTEGGQQSPAGARRPRRRTPPPEIVKPEPPLNAEPLPTVVAPLITAPADHRDRAGVLQDARGESESRGPGTGGGAGTGSGTGLGSGDGAGVGPGIGRGHRGRTVPAGLGRPAASSAARSPRRLHRRGPAQRDHRRRRARNRRPLRRVGRGRPGRAPAWGGPRRTRRRGGPAVAFRASHAAGSPRRRGRRSRSGVPAPVGVI